MNYSKYFPLTLHAILAFVAVGTAAGADAEHLRPIIQYQLSGLAVGLAATAWLRFLDT